MGRVRNSNVKRAAKNIVEKYFPKLDCDFHHNKRVLESVTEIQTKRFKNQIAGYVTHLYTRVEKGKVKKIFIKKHEEERERRENMIPSSSIMDTEKIEVDDITMQMIKDYCYRGNYVVSVSEEQ
uniref:eS17 n=1 Tax=Paranosema locustae TaxID=235221 RepID=UPI00187D6DF6|nr:Chain SR0, eS17 [Paranosema locustae]|eukprot:jgi/Antlo1/649/342